MELPSKILDQTAFNTRPKIEAHMLIFRDKSIHEEYLSQPFQTNNKQFNVAVTFLTGYNGIFDVKNSNIKFYFMKSVTDEDGYIQNTIPPGAYEIESLRNKIKRIIIDEGHFTEANCPFTNKSNFSTLGPNIEISPQGPIFSFLFDDSIRDLLGFSARTLYEQSIPTKNPVDILTFDNIFLECDIAQGASFKGARSGIIHNIRMDVDPGYKYVDNFRGGVKWYMMDSKDVISSINFKL